MTDGKGPTKQPFSLPRMRPPKKPKGAGSQEKKPERPPPPLLTVGQTVTMRPEHCERFAITAQDPLTVQAEMWLGPKGQQTQTVMVTRQDGYVTHYLNFRGQWVPLPLNPEKTFSATWLAAVHFVPMPLE